MNQGIAANVAEQEAEPLGATRPTNNGVKMRPGGERGLAPVSCLGVLVVKNSRLEQ